MSEPAIYRVIQPYTHSEEFFSLWDVETMFAMLPHYYPWSFLHENKNKEINLRDMFKAVIQKGWMMGRKRKCQGLQL